MFTIYFIFWIETEIPKSKCQYPYIATNKRIYTRLISIESQPKKIVVVVVVVIGIVVVSVHVVVVVIPVVDPRNIPLKFG